MAEKLTNEQQAAVDSRERSLLVSAAAGSGKTKVLVERLFSYVEREGANLDDFLIITYTRAAASELRGKIAKALTERMERDPGNYHLRQQMLRVYRADIKTVDAFCTALLRENCHLLGEDARGHALRPDFRVLDENEAQVLRERVLARTLDDFYDSLTPGGTLLADTLGAGRDDSALEDLVLELHAKLQAQPYEDKWLEAQRAFWRAVPDKIEDTPYGKILLNEVRRKARHCKNLLQRAAQEMCANDALNQKYAPAFLDASYQLDALEGKTVEGWDTARGVTIAFPRLAAVKDSDGGEMKARMKSLWDNCKETVKGFAEIFSASSDEAVEDLRTMAPAMLALIDLTADFSRRYNEEKRRRNSADFSDQEHEAIRLLIGEDGAPTELARIVSARYREIMVDEYQDTNEVQNRIFDAISCKGENLFTVGDVKQSIYRFRLADPRIFLQHYNTWPPLEDAEEHDSAKLLLSRNFRSRKEVLDATNFIFCNILSEEMGELDYGADEMLRLGANYVESSACGAEFHLLDLPTQTGEQRVRASEAEAAFVADYISDMLTSEFPIQDDKTKELRPVREEDIVILMRSPSTRLLDYRRALEARGLHCAADAGEDFFASMEIAVLFALLQVIDNPRQDVPLIAVLRSPLFGFTPDELAAIRARQRTGDFYDALLLSEDDHSREFLDTLDALRNSAAHLSVRELLSEIYRRCNVLGIFGAMRRGAERKENLLAFLELSEDYALGAARPFRLCAHTARAACRRRGGDDADRARLYGRSHHVDPQVKGPRISGRDPLGPRASLQQYGLFEFGARAPAARAGAGVRGHAKAHSVPDGRTAGARANAAARGEGRGAACAVRCDDAREGKARHGAHAGKREKPRRRPSGAERLSCAARGCGQRQVHGRLDHAAAFAAQRSGVPARACGAEWRGELLC